METEVKTFKIVAKVDFKVYNPESKTGVRIRRLVFKGFTTASILASSYVLNTEIEKYFKVPQIYNIYLMYLYIYFIIVIMNTLISVFIVLIDIIVPNANKVVIGLISFCNLSDIISPVDNLCLTGIKVLGLFLIYDEVEKLRQGVTVTKVLTSSAVVLAYFFVNVRNVAKYAKMVEYFDNIYPKESSLYLNSYTGIIMIKHLQQYYSKNYQGLLTSKKLDFEITDNIDSSVVLLSNEDWLVGRISEGIYMNFGDRKLCKMINRISFYKAILESSCVEKLLYIIPVSKNHINRRDAVERIHRFIKAALFNDLNYEVSSLKLYRPLIGNLMLIFFVFALLIYFISYLALLLINVALDCFCKYDTSRILPQFPYGTFYANEKIFLSVNDMHTTISVSLIDNWFQLNIFSNQKDDKMDV